MPELKALQAYFLPTHSASHTHTSPSHTPTPPTPAPPAGAVSVPRAGSAGSGGGRSRPASPLNPARSVVASGATAQSGLYEGTHTGNDASTSGSGTNGEVTVGDMTKTYAEWDASNRAALALQLKLDTVGGNDDTHTHTHTHPHTHSVLYVQ